MDIIVCGSRPSKKMGAPSFTGTVWQDPIIQTPEPARSAAGYCVWRGSFLYLADAAKEATYGR